MHEGRLTKLKEVKAQIKKFSLIAFLRTGIFVLFELNVLSLGRVDV